MFNEEDKAAILLEFVELIDHPDFFVAEYFTRSRDCVGLLTVVES